MNRLLVFLAGLALALPSVTLGAIPGEQFLNFQFLPKDPRYQAGSGGYCTPWFQTSEPYPYFCSFVTPDGTVTNLVEPVEGPFPLMLPLPRGSRVTSIEARLSAADWGSNSTYMFLTFGPWSPNNDVVLGPPQLIPQNAWCDYPLQEYIFSATAPSGGTLGWDPSVCNHLTLSWADNGFHSPLFQYLNVKVGYVPPPSVHFDVPDQLPPNREREARLTVDDGRARFYSSKQTVNGTIEVSGTLKDTTGLVYPNTPVFFRVYDPADTKPYNRSSTAGDNFDTANRGILVGENANRYLVASTDTNGRFSVALSTNTVMSGETYQIESSPDSYIANASTACSALVNCTRSATYTTWRRADIEQDGMFAKGAFLATPTASNSTRVHYVSMRGVSFSIGDRVALIGAPTGASPSFKSEDFTVTNTGRGYIELDRPPVHVYVASANPQEPHLGDAIGLIGSQYIPDSSLVASLFAEAFVDYARLPNSLDTFDWVPYMYRPYIGPLEQMLRRWAERRADRNTHFVVAGEEVATNSHLGVTWHLGKMTAVLAKEIASRGGSQAPAFLQEVTVHEVVHQWQANADKPSDHCDLPTWQANDGTAFCIMKKELLDGTRAAVEFLDGNVSFHWVAAAPPNRVPDSEYMRIRASSGF